MGLYVNPGNEGFKTIRKSLYVDKSGVIDVINGLLNTRDKLTCISRARRFGKSFTAQLLCAYYGKTCVDSEELFSDLSISQSDSYKEHLGKYNVIYLDITGFISPAKDANKIVDNIRSSITQELFQEFPTLESKNTFGETLASAAELNGAKFFFIIHASFKMHYKISSPEQ